MDAAVDVEALMRGIHARIMAREGVLVPEAVMGPAGTESQFFQLKRHEVLCHHKFAAFGREVQVHRRGLLGRMEFLAKRGFRKLLGWHTRPQIDFNGSVARAISECLKHLVKLSAGLDGLRAENQALREQMAALLSEEPFTIN